jgi:hypothetical protein
VSIRKKPTQDNIAEDWEQLCVELSNWCLAHLANRQDAYGAYYYGGQVTRRGNVDCRLLIDHFLSQDGGQIVGLHTASADNLSKGGALDIDQHGDDPVRTEANRLAALHWYSVLVRMGFRPLLTASNGKGGYHLRVLLAEAIDAARVFHFFRRLTMDHRRVGLGKAPEQFPRQVDVRKCAKGMGNWIRVPGRHHKRDYWSEVWDGSRWLAGHDAIEFILALTGDDPQLIPEVPPEPERVEKPRRGIVLRATNGTRGNLALRIAAYCAKLPHASEGEGRDDIAYRFACWLVRDVAVSDSIALAWLERWDKGNWPPKGTERLKQIIESAHAYGQRSVGCGLETEQPEYDGQGHRILRARAEIY